MQIGIFYGSDTGNTQVAAETMQSLCTWAEVEIFDIADCELANMDQFQHLIFGIPTTDCGEVQADWEDFFALLAEIDWSNKSVALYGLGDQFAYGEFFLDAMGILHQQLEALSVHIVGQWPVEGYTFSSEVALNESKNAFLGLALDDDNEDELTEGRIALWLEQLEKEFTASAAA